jgi:hypothetical protein
MSAASIKAGASERHTKSFSLDRESRDSFKVAHDDRGDGGAAEGAHTKSFTVDNGLASGKRAK